MSGSWAQAARYRPFAREDLVAAEVAAVGQGGDFLETDGLLCLKPHRHKLLAIVPLIGHLVGHDQMVLGVDGDLYIVADVAVSLPLVAIERASGSVSEICWSGAS